MTPESPLPYVDELDVDVGADRDATWSALLRVVEGSFASARGRGPAWLLACEDTVFSRAAPAGARLELPRLPRRDR